MYHYCSGYTYVCMFLQFGLFPWYRGICFNQITDVGSPTFMENNNEINLIFVYLNLQRLSGERKIIMKIKVLLSKISAKLGTQTIDNDYVPL